MIFILFSLFTSILCFKADVYRTQQAGKEKFAKLPSVTFGPTIPGAEVIKIDLLAEKQEIIGFGSSFTQTAAYNYNSLNAARKKEVLDLLFSPDKTKGNGYTVCRTTINSCDFSLVEYTYVKDGDKTLESFDLGEDRKYVLPFLQDVTKYVGKDLYLFGSPWSPPGWMKDNNKMINGGKLKKEYWDTWGLYFAKYIQAYHDEGVEFWAVTIQNEPMASQSWESCLYSGAEEGQFAVNNLRPNLDKAGLEHVHILAWDHNKGVTQQRADETYGVAGAIDAVWGLANHWYDSPCCVYAPLTDVHNKYPTKHLTISEFTRGGSNYGGPSSNEDFPYSNYLDFMSYAEEIIGDLNNWVESVTDWNMLVNDELGPYHNRGNGDKAPITVNKDGTYEIGYIYYTMGHFSRFIKRGARILDTKSWDANVRATSARNPDGTLALVIYNKNDQARTGTIVLGDNSNGYQIELPPHSLFTFDITD